MEKRIYSLALFVFLKMVRWYGITQTKHFKNEKIFEWRVTIYLNKIPDEALYSYNVYQIEGEGRSLLKIEGDEDTVMVYNKKNTRVFRGFWMKKYLVMRQSNWTFLVSKTPKLLD